MMKLKSFHANIFVFVKNDNKYLWELETVKLGFCRVFSKDFQPERFHKK